MRRPFRAALFGAVVACVAAIAPAAPASAHDYLIDSQPGARATVTAATPTVTLTFDQAVLNGGRGSTVLAVVGPNGRHYETSCARVLDRRVAAPTRLGPAGRYAVVWRVVSADGHPVSDSLRFTYRPAAGAATARGSASGPDCGAGRIEVPAERTATGTPIVFWAVVGVGGALLVLALVALTVLVVRARRSSG